VITTKMYSKSENNDEKKIDVCSFDFYDANTKKTIQKYIQNNDIMDDEMKSIVNKLHECDILELLLCSIESKKEEITLFMLDFVKNVNTPIYLASQLAKTLETIFVYNNRTNLFLMCCSHHQHNALDKILQKGSDIFGDVYDYWRGRYHKYKYTAGGCLDCLKIIIGKHHKYINLHEVGEMIPYMYKLISDNETEIIEYLSNIDKYKMHVALAMIDRKTFIQKHKYLCLYSNTLNNVKSEMKKIDNLCEKKSETRDCNIL